MLRWTSVELVPCYSSLENYRVIVALHVEEDNGALARFAPILCDRASHLKTHLQRTQAIESAFSNPTMLDLATFIHISITVTC